MRFFAVLVLLAPQGAAPDDTPIDAFIIAKLKEKGLQPAPPADKRTLLRRATIDLTGLPPTPEEIDAYLSDNSPDAFSRVVDRLLASPHYGERWGRHWLDVVRYGESHGYERNHLRPNAWPYRDYVIRAFNEDKPYTDFIAEQLAGDLMGRDEAATGFLVAGVHDDVASPEVTLTRTQRANDLDDIVSTVGSAFLGLTVGCARCHDHKFDPIPQKDYYRMAAVFAGVRHDERPITPRAEVERMKKESDEISLKLRDPNPTRNVEEFAPVPARFVRFTVQATKDGIEPCIDEIRIYAPGGEENLALAGKASASSLYPNAKIHQVHHLNDGKYGNDWSWISGEKGAGWAQIELAETATVGRVVWSRDAVEKPKFKDRLPSAWRVEVSEDGTAWKTVASVDDRELRRRMAALKPAMAYIGKFTPPDAIHVLRRGDVMQPAEAVTPGALSQIFPAELEGDARPALARWIGDPRNPLTARVMVNRVWQHHFGRGIVGTPSDFGKNGEPPTHPELLDWLAADFTAGGSRLKRLHRAIMLSNTYRQSSRGDPRAEAVDAGNRLLWRMPLRRLEAEALRDSILAVSGKLDRAMGGPGFRLFTYRVNNIAFYEPVAEQGPETWRRAVYQQAARAYREDLLACFDAPENSQRAPRRDVTTTPPQALSLLNAPFVVRQAGFFAERAKTVDGAFRLAFGRLPDASERKAALGMDLALVCRALFNANEFLYY